jgi:hypothetical protein
MNNESNDVNEDATLYDNSNDDTTNTLTSDGK